MIKNDNSMTPFVDPDEFSEVELERLPKRVKYKIVLVRSFDKVWSRLSTRKSTYPKGCEKVITKSFKRDLKRGLKIVDKKVPLYIELPDYTKAGNGMYKVVDSTLKNADENIVVSADLVPTTHRVVDP